MHTGETWTLLAVEWGLSETFDAHSAAAIFERSGSLHEVRPCPVPGVTLLAYRSAVVAVDDALRVVSQARAKVVLVTGECESSNLVGFSELSSRLYSLLTIVPFDVVVCALSTFEAIRHVAGPRVVCTDLGPVGLPQIGGRERVFQVAAEGAPFTTISIDPGERAIDTLPSRFGYFVGRGPELDRCFLYLEQRRCVTVTGVAGIGKSHFACRVAREVQGSYSAGAAWVSLAQASTLEEIFTAFAKGLGLAPSPEVSGTVRRIISEEQLLVVLDGADGCAELLVGLLQAQFHGAVSQFIVTAVRPLDYDLEEVIVLAPMTAPPPDWAPTLDDLYEFEATSLFLDRVGDINENLIGYLDAESVAKLAQALGGHPQAICLAAAQTRFDSVEMILAGIASRPGRPGHRHAIAGSMSGLPKRAQNVALALSLCETPISAFQLARLDPEYPNDPASLDILLKAGLCGETISPSGRVVYSLYPSVKMHLRKAVASGRAKLKRRHEDLFLELAKDTVAGHTMTARAGDLDIAEEQAPDIFVALRSLTKHVSTASFYETVREVYPFLYDHNHINEGLEVLNEAVAKANSSEELPVAKLLNAAASLATKAGRSKQARKYCEAGLGRLGKSDDGHVRATLVAALAMIEWSEGNSELARDQLVFAQDLFRLLGRNDQVAKALVSSVLVHIECGDSEAAQIAMERVEQLWASPTPLQHWCLQLARGQIEWAKGNYIRARLNVADSIRTALEMSDQLSLLRSLIWLAQVLSDANATKASTHVLAVAAHNQTEQAYRLYRTNEMRVERVRERLMVQLGEAKYRAEFIAGSVQSLDQVLASIY